MWCDAWPEAEEERSRPYLTSGPGGQVGQERFQQQLLLDAEPRRGHRRGRIRVPVRSGGPAGRVMREWVPVAAR